MIADDYAAIAARMRGARQQEPQGACPKCEGGGWMEVYSQHPPEFRECDQCFNPEGHPCP